MLKLEAAKLIADREAVFEEICKKLNETVSLASATGAAGEEKETDGGRVAVLLREVYSEITEEAERLGVYGGAIQYIAEEIKRPLKYISE